MLCWFPLQDDYSCIYFQTTLRCLHHIRRCCDPDEGISSTRSHATKTHSEENRSSSFPNQKNDRYSMLTMYKMWHRIHTPKMAIRRSDRQAMSTARPWSA